MSERTPEPAAPEDIDFGDAPDHVKPLVGKTTFERWHHPRAHEIRLEQWCAPIKALIKELSLPKGATFNYLTLPGDEMLDIRVLNHVCEGEEVELKYLGFNDVGHGTSRQAEFNLSQSEVRDLKGVNKFSRVLEERLEAVANADSLARHSMVQFGPFHAINIDLCGSLTERESDDSRGSPLGVLGGVLDTQLKTASPWLLFVNSRAEPALVASGNRAGFQQAIDANIEVSERFAEALGACISAGDDLSKSIEATWDTQTPDFVRLFGAGLGKWLLGILGTSTPERSLTLLSSVYYQIGDDGPDMISMAFRCDTILQPLVDPNGLLPTAQPFTPVSEVELAIALARSLQASENLDLKLAKDPARAEKMLGDSRALMTTARFDPKAYEVWARAELQRNRIALGLEAAAV